MIKDVEDDADELPDSDFVKAAARLFDKIDHGKDGVLPYSKFVYLIETLEGRFHSDNMEGHLKKLDLNESGSLDRSAFVRWYMDEEVSLDSAEEVERLVGWGCKFSLMDLQCKMFLRIHALKRERDQERLSL